MEQDPNLALGLLTTERLKKLGHYRMPFGRYQGCLVVELPEAYLLWFRKQEQFPVGELGTLMQLALELHIHGLTGLINPLKQPHGELPSTDDSKTN